MESIFQQAGSCGCFQISHVFLIQMLRIVCIWSLSLMMFGNYEPPWQCVNYIRHANSTFLNTSLNLQSHSRLDHANANFENLSSTTKDPNYLGNSFLASMSWIVTNSAYVEINDTVAIFDQGTCDRLSQCEDVIFDPTSVTFVSDYRLICERAYIPSVIIAAQMVGVLVGSSLSGQLGEALGRKKNIYGSLILMSVATFASSWSTSWQMHLGLLFLVGVGGGGITVSNFVYTMEFLNPKWRGRVGAAPVMNIAIMLFSCIVIFLKNWRQVHLACGALSSLFVLGALWVPESIRWLHVHGREDESKNVLAKMMKCNKRKGDVTAVLQRLKEEIRRDEMKPDRRFTYLDLFRTTKIRTLTIKVAIIWFALITSFYTLNFSVKAFSGDYYINLFLSCSSEIPLSLVLYLSVNKLGRKIASSIFMLLSSMASIAYVTFYYVASEEVSGTIIRYLAIAAKGSISVAWTTMVIHCVELFPTVIRNVAMGFVNTVSRIGVILGTTLIPRDQESLAICFIVLSGFLVVAFVIALTLPETKNKPLDDTIKQSEIREERGQIINSQ